MEDEKSYLSSLIAKLYENTTGSFGVESPDNDSDVIIKQECDNYSDGPESKKRKVVDEEEEFFKNSSAAMIAESTERTLKQMNIDPNSKEGKIQRRKIRNRMSAQIHRDRKKAYIEFLEEKVRKRDEVISIMQKMLKKCHKENEQLRRDLEQFVDCKIVNGDNTLNTNLTKEALACKSVSIQSPADSSTSSESAFRQHDESATNSQHSSSPEMEPDYFSDFEVNCDFDSKIFGGENDLWLPEQYEDLSLDLDMDQSLGDDEIMRVPIQGSSTVGGSMSMFSLVLMMSFSFLTGLFSMGAMGGGMVSSTSFLDTSNFGSSFISQPWSAPPSLSLNRGSRVDYSFGLLPVTERNNIDESETLDGSSPSDVSTILPSGGGRVLLSLPSFDDETSDESYDYNHHSEARPNSLGKYARTISRPGVSLSSLWRKQNYDFIGTIYPPRSVENEQNTSSENSTKINKMKKHLRYRSTDENVNVTKSRLVGENSGTVRNSDNGYESTHSTDKVVAVYRSEPKATFGHDHESSQISSKVLLSEGRVLLNPLLANLHKADLDKSSRSGSRVHEAGNDRAIIPSVTSLYSNSAFAGDMSDNSLSDDNKVLTMMIPASTIQWGFEWLDDSSPDNSDIVMQHLLKTFNASGFDHDYDSETGTGSLDMSKLWVEIGCKVVDAKLVQSVL